MIKLFLILLAIIVSPVVIFCGLISLILIACLLILIGCFISAGIEAIVDFIQNMVSDE